MPCENAAGTLVGRLGRQPAAADVGPDEGGDIGGGDLLDTGGLYSGQFAAAIRPRLRWPLHQPGAELAAGDLQGRVDRTEHRAEIVDIRLGALGGLDRADMFDIAGEDIRQ